EHVDFPHPRFLCLACSPGGDGDGYTAELVHDRRLPLAAAIRDLWSGALFYRGPAEGMQTVGLEIMRDRCWRCHAALDTVTGIVFPDREVIDWAAPDWAYYRQLLDLARIPDGLIPALSAAIESWRAAGDRRLTVIRWRHSKTVDYAYWAAECTACGAFRGDYPLMEERQQWLDTLESRRAGVLSYRPVRLDVPRQALQELTWGWEVNPHACFLGWRRTGDPQLARSPAAPAAPAAPATEGTPEADAAAGAPAGIAAAAAAFRLAETAVHVLSGPGLLPPPLGPATVPGAGPLRRVGEILAAWLGSLGSLGWMGARRRPSILVGRPAPPTPSPPAPAPRPAAGR
ncbi:MAG: hypothetical protein JOZ15_16290, partial [Acidobacteria bacterium]|nr:hypothetical protein [Acidobacteriota bacterium]